MTGARERAACLFAERHRRHRRDVDRRLLFAQAQLSRTQKLKTDPTDIKQTRVGMVGNNLHIEDIRNHVSHIPKIKC
jgi:hypothetical protein